MAVERDKAVEALLRAKTSRADGPLCLEPDVLAAWVDGGLTAPEVEQIEAHVADCSRCQALVATFVRAAQPDDLRAASEERRPWWKRGWGLGLLVPLTAGVAAIAIYVAQPAYRNPTATLTAPSQKEADASPKLQAPAAETSPQANEKRKAAAAAAPEALRDQAKTEANIPARPREPAEGRLKRDEQERALSDTRSRSDEASKDASAAQGGSVTSNIAPVAAPAAAPPPPATVAGASAQPAPARQNARAVDAARPSDASLRSFAQSDAGTRDIVSPNPTVRWRVGAAGSIQYSTTGGSSWQPLASGVAVDLTAGASPSASVCWVVGRSGTVLLTTNGIRWQRVAFPETLDLTAVEAADARSAKVTAVTGRSFRTVDGGATWTTVQDF